MIQNQLPQTVLSSAVIKASLKILLFKKSSSGKDWSILMRKGVS